MSVAFEEQETTINLYPSIVSTDAEIYTCIPAMRNKLKKYAAENPNIVRVTKEDEYGLFVTLPAKWVTVRKPVTRNLTDEQKAEIAARMQAGREKRAKS